MTAFPRESQEPWEKKSYMPIDLICRWCRYYEHDELGVYWVHFRCALDHTDIAMWGTCDAFANKIIERTGYEAHLELSAHERAALLTRKGASYHVSRA